MAEQELFVGIDVSKRTLEVALGAGGELLRMENRARAASPRWWHGGRGLLPR